MAGDRLGAVTVNGACTPVELMVLGIGAAPETQLAKAAGLECSLDGIGSVGGIVVDAAMRTSDPAILAIGDCANFPEHGGTRRLRLESVQNANRPGSHLSRS